VTDLLLPLVGAALGLVLGLLGGGGGVLAVPLLVAVGLPFLQASTMSLVVVGTGAAAALVPHHRARRVDWPVGLTFGALGAVGSIAGAWLATLLPTAVLLGGLAALLVAGASAMLSSGLRGRAAARATAPIEGSTDPAADLPAPDDAAATGDPAASGTPTGALTPATDPEHLLLDSPELGERSIALATRRVSAPGRTRITPRVLGLASAVGLVTGLFGVGAGFVVVPALVAAMRLPVKRATATALVVIVMNSLVALVVRSGSLTDVRTTVGLALVTAVFAVVGALLSRRIPGWILSTTFGVLLAAVSVYTLVEAVTTG
jgi:uncharacterized membrane protein YfcA